MTTEVFLRLFSIIVSLRNDEGNSHDKASQINEENNRAERAARNLVQLSKYVKQ